MTFTPGGAIESSPPNKRGSLLVRLKKSRSKTDELFPVRICEDVGCHVANIPFVVGLCLWLICACYDTALV